MAILRNILTFSALSLLLTGCYEDFNPNIDTTPVLCLNSLITAGEPIEVEVTHTWIYSEGRVDQVNYSVDDVVVSIYANEALVDVDYIPREGDRIRISADSKKYGKADAAVTVPFAVRNADVKYTATLVSDWHSNENWKMNSDVKFDVNIKMTLNDTPDRADYYRFSFFGFVDWDSGHPGAFIDPPMDFYAGTFDEKFEPIFSEHIGVFESIMGSETDGFSFFTDRQFDGKAYTLRLKFTNAGYNVRDPIYDEELLNCGYVLELQSVSQSYYNWENYKWQIENGVTGDIIDFGFGDPMWGYSNVSTGAGVVAARSISKFKVNLKDFLQTIIVKPTNE